MIAPDIFGHFGDKIRSLRGALRARPLFIAVPGQGLGELLLIYLGSGASEAIRVSASPLMPDKRQPMAKRTALLAWCRGTWLDGHTGLPLAFMKGSGGACEAGIEGRKAFCLASKSRHLRREGGKWVDLARHAGNQPSDGEKSGTGEERSGRELIGV